MKVRIAQNAGVMKVKFAQNAGRTKIARDDGMKKKRPFGSAHKTKTGPTFVGWK